MPPSRRGHLSTKVPWARNRPAPAPDAGSESSAKRRRLAHDSQADQEDDDFRKNARDADADEARAEDFEGDEPKPLRGAVICMTGIDEDKKELIRCAEFLGATVEGNLTEDATHLIATKPGSEKFRCAVRLGMHILRPAWLTDMRELWRKELPVDVDKLIDIHRLDTFEGLDFALAGFQEREDRSQLRRQLMSDAGKCGQTFTLGGPHTHLICNDDAPKTSNTYKTVHEWRRKASRWERRGEQIPDPDSEKPGTEGQTAARNMRMARALKCVRREWVEDSLRIRAALDESMYLIENPKATNEQREAMRSEIEMQRDRLNKRWAQARKLIDSRNAKARHAGSTMVGASKSTSVAKESPHPEGGVQASARSTSLSKLVGQIAATKGKSSEPSSSSKDPRVIAASTAPPAEKVASSLASMSRQAKFVPQATSPLGARTVVAATGEPLKAAPPAPSPAAPAKSVPVAVNEASTSRAGAAKQSSLFAGKTVRLDVAKERMAVFEKALLGEGAKVIDSDDDAGADFCLTSLSVGGKDRKGKGQERRGVEVTHLWLERCINARSILSLDQTPFARPSRHAFPLPGADRLHVALTGLSDGPDCVQAQKLLTDMGVGSASSCFGRGRNTHLLTGPGAEQDEASMSANIKAKLSKAAQWEVPVRPLLSFVRDAWESGRFEPAGAPLVRSRGGSAMPSTAMTSVGSTARQGLDTQSLGDTQQSGRSGPGGRGMGPSALRRSTQSLGSESLGNMESIPEKPSAETKPVADITNGEAPQRGSEREDARIKQPAPQATPPNAENAPGGGRTTRSPWQKSHSASQAEEQRQPRAQEAGLDGSPGRVRETSMPPPRDPSAMDTTTMEETMVGTSFAVDAVSDDILAMMQKNSRRSDGSGSGAVRKKAKFARSRFRGERAASSAGPEERGSGLPKEGGEGSPTRAEKLLASRREEDARREREGRGGMADWETLQSSPGRAMQQQQATTQHQRLLGSRAAAALQHQQHHNPSISQQTQVPLHGGAAGTTSGMESLGPRIVYDDPAARKERKRIEDMIRASKGGESGGASSPASASPTATKV